MRASMLTPLLLLALLSSCASLSRPQPEVQLADIQPTGKATLFEQERKAGSARTPPFEGGAALKALAGKPA